jgi:hypothetical protein
METKNRHIYHQLTGAVVKLNGLWRSHHNATGTAASLENWDFSPSFFTQKLKDIPGLVNVNRKLLKMAIEIVELPIKNDDVQ